MVLAGQLHSETRSDLHRLDCRHPAAHSALGGTLRRDRGEPQHPLPPGSAPVLDADGKYRNRAFLFGPQGLIGVQDKQIMTRFEHEKCSSRQAFMAEDLRNTDRSARHSHLLRQRIPDSGPRPRRTGRRPHPRPFLYRHARRQLPRPHRRSGQSAGKPDRRSRLADRRQRSVVARHGRKTRAAPRSMCRRITACRPLACLPKARKTMSQAQAGW